MKISKRIICLIICFSFLIFLASCNGVINISIDDNTTSQSEHSSSSSEASETSLESSTNESIESTTKDTYIVTFKDENETTLFSLECNKGEIPSYNGQVPTKVSTSEYSYEFDGWYTSKEGGNKVTTFPEVNSSVTYYARFKKTKNKYTVVWKNYDGTILETDSDLEYGVMPEYNGSTPIKQSDQNNQYVFEKWDKEITPVTGNIEYVAVFKAVPYSYCLVQFDSKGGTNIDSQYISKGEKATKPSNPIKEGYTFDDWYYQGERWSFIGYTVTENMTLEARWNINSYTLSLSSNNTKAGTISNNGGSHNYNESITITATTNPGYTFNGWFKGDDLVSPLETYTFNMPASNLSYIAKWTANTNTAYKVEHYLQNIDNTNYPSTPYEIDNLTGITDTLTNGSVNTYEGFTSPNVTQKNINGDETTVIKLYYTRNSYTVALNKDNNNAGKITGAGTYKYGKEITIEATTNPGYTFIGWYDGDNELSKNPSYIFNMLAKSLSYTAKWIANTDTTYKVEHYQQNLDDDNYHTTPFETDNLTGTTDTLTNGSVKTYEGFTSPSITQVNINGNGSTVIKLYYTRNRYTVTLKTNIDNAGTITGSGKYKYGKTITIANQTNPGYTFVGWHIDNQEYTTASLFDYEVSADVEFEARYITNQYKITLDNQAEGVTISGVISGNEYYFNTKVTLSSVNNSGLFLVWTVNGSVEHVGDEYSFNVPANDMNITINTRVENKLYFGTYPQTKLDETNDASKIFELNDLAGDLPTSSNLGNWVDYNYYIEGTITSFMFYQDIDYDNDGVYDYRGVYFTSYRPPQSFVNATYPTQRDYTTNNIHWFSYEPIEWDILSEANDKKLIIANLILDNQDYCSAYTKHEFSHNGGKGYENNYELSDIRKWLNDNFYNTAFNDLQKVIIETTTVDNSASSTYSYSNSYACNNTNDKMFLLSSKEATAYYNNKSERCAIGSDYAKCQGLTVSNSSSSLGFSEWWLRSPYNYDNPHGDFLTASKINFEGVDYYFTSVDYILGVRPACWIILQLIDRRYNMNKNDIKSIFENIKIDGYKCFVSEAQLRDVFAIYLNKRFKNSFIYPEFTIPDKIDLFGKKR